MGKAQRGPLKLTLRSKRSLVLLLRKRSPMLSGILTPVVAYNRKGSMVTTNLPLVIRSLTAVVSRSRRMLKQLVHGTMVSQLVVLIRSTLFLMVPSLCAYPPLPSAVFQQTCFELLLSYVENICHLLLIGLVDDVLDGL